MVKLATAYEEQLARKLRELKVSDLVETCAMEPGFIVSIDDSGDCDVYNPKSNKVTSHHVVHCGVHKITWEYAALLWALGERKLKKIYASWPEGKEWCYETLKDYVSSVHSKWVIDQVSVLDKVKR
jgi:hypothetical protein